jgi:two-component system, NarL family, sensor histidine kinase DesK
VIRLSRLLLVGRWVMVSLTLLFVLSLPERVVSTNGPPVWVQTAVLLAPGAVWAFFWLRVVGSRRPLLPAAVLVVYLALAVLAFYVVPHDRIVIGGILVFGAILAGASFSWRPALFAMAAVLLVQTLVDIEQRPPNLVGTLLADAINTLFVGVATIGGRLLIVSQLELTTARGEIARLAVAEERLRFARDLHDLLGQTLATVVLMSEVVARRLPADTAPELRQELQEVAQVARRALDEVREAVAGYRQTSLEAELANAVIALRAAGIAGSYDNQVGRLAPESEAALSWALREAVTNVIRHSQARTCRVTIARSGGAVRLQVVDDGQSQGRSIRLGNGLRGIAERARAVGGDSTAQPTAEGFRTTVEVPAS